MGIQMLLEGVILPAEDIVSVAGVASRIASRPDEWLAAISGPVCLVVELPSIPNCLEQDLREPDGMSLGAWATRFEGARFRICHMVFVVRRIKVDSIPAGGEAVVGHDASGTRLCWEANVLRFTGARVLHADVRQLTIISGLLASVVSSLANKHTEARLESSNLRLLCSVEESIRHVVDHLNLRLENY